MGKGAGNSRQSGLKCHRWSLYASPHALKGKGMPVSPRHILGEAVSINFSKSWPWTHIFLIFCHEKASTQKAIVLHTEVWCSSEGKALVWLSCELNQTIFFTEDHFYFKRMTEKNLFFRLRYLTGIFLKMDKVGLSLWGRLLTIFVADDKTWAFK